MLSKIGQRVTFCTKCGRKRRLASQPNRVRLCLPTVQKQHFIKVHGEAWKPAFTCWYARTSIVEPSCEALTDGSAHPSSHLMRARRLKEGESVYLAFHVHLRKRTIHPSPRLPEKPILAKCEQRHFAQQPIQRERAWVTRGCKALEGRSFHGFLKRPRKATANLHSYIKTGIDRGKQKPWVFY